MAPSPEIANQFYRAIRDHLNNNDLDIYVPENLDRAIEADALAPDVFWVNAKIRCSFESITNAMQNAIASHHPEVETRQ